METTEKTSITVQTSVKASAAKVWNYWNAPEHITKWCQASDDWHAPYAENDLREGGSFKTTMAAKDGSMQFDFGGVYDEVIPEKKLAYTMSDGRQVSITFSPKGDSVEVVEIFDAEKTHSLEMQQAGWQAILENFRKYTESN